MMEMLYIFVKTWIFAVVIPKFEYIKKFGYTKQMLSNPSNTFKIPITTAELETGGNPQTLYPFLSSVRIISESFRIIASYV